MGGFTLSSTQYSILKWVVHMPIECSHPPLLNGRIHLAKYMKRCACVVLQATDLQCHDIHALVHTREGQFYVWEFEAEFFRLHIPARYAEHNVIVDVGEDVRCKSRE